ncbi:hypothetical protein [Acidobacterium sp.]|uniref:Uncharacterized protein n=1 Tax=Acidobacterium capsulatum (strain ATCC 51196 / DSM 11244 / BCRC 80197 / JCM 7670 / NBRC 15755 / NCIMB 13165 / 161) TaxID=240015 RepID=C1F1H0_ACIC5|nr:hypothetical protein [Acidobacterium sp.]ACO32481.1 hypothetical protein ACP_0570 [Acidobacterium capsulatum ATCC 51196]HCT61904.1 hypothetical protein [Acidobacterium sp.]
MADQLYLSLWYANFRFPQLPGALDRVLQQFAALGGTDKVKAATVYPLSWNESPIYQWVHSDKDPEENAEPAQAIARAMEALHEDYAYEFEVEWELWTPSEEGGEEPGWKLEPRVVRVTGFGPQFDEGSFDQNGQIRIDLGTDTPFLQEEVALSAESAAYVKKNVQKLVDLTTLMQKNAGAATRLLWSESGENLAQKLIARLQQLN